MEKEGPVKMFRTILRLMIKGQAFALCPDCRKNLNLFEVYNENCAYCGDIVFDEIIMIKGHVDTDEEIAEAKLKKRKRKK